MTDEIKRDYILLSMPHTPEESPLSSQENQPTPRITIKEQRTNPGFSDLKLYGIDVHTDSKVVRFVELLIDEDGAVLSWPGTIDFSQLESTALNEISFLLTGGKNMLQADDEQAQKATEVTFITNPSDSPENDSLREFSLKNARQRASYRQLLGHPEKIAFARYDVTSPTLSYSVTIDNTSHPRSEKYPEIAVSLPYSHNWTEGIVSLAQITHVDPEVKNVTQEDVLEVFDAITRTIQADKNELATPPQQ